MGADASRVDAGGRDAGGRDGGACAREVRLSVEASEPSTVVLIVDASSSMQRDFGAGLSRWEAVREALTGRDGVIRRLEDRVPFGLIRYSASFMCPTLESRPAELRAGDGIATLLLATPPGGSTPTAETLREARADVARLAGDSTGPVSFVLATDGEPVPCDSTRDEAEIRRRVVEQVGLAYDEGVRTFVLSVGADLSEGHLQDLANAGANVGPGDPDAPAWRADDPAALTELIATAIGAAVACVARLPWSEANPCDAEVELDGDPLICDDADGFRIEGNQLLFAGAACAAWESGARALVRTACE